MLLGKESGEEEEEDFLLGEGRGDRSTPLACFHGGHISLSLYNAQLGMGG